MSSSSSRMVHIDLCLQELLPFVQENQPFFDGVYKLCNLDHNFMNLVTLFRTIMSSSSSIMVYSAQFKSYCTLLTKILHVMVSGL